MKLVLMGAMVALLGGCSLFHPSNAADDRNPQAVPSETTPSVQVQAEPSTKSLRRRRGNSSIQVPIPQSEPSPNALQLQTGNSAQPQQRIQGNPVQPEIRIQGNSVQHHQQGDLYSPMMEDSEVLDDAPFVPPKLGSERIIVSPGTRQQMEGGDELEMEDSP